MILNKNIVAICICALLSTSMLAQEADTLQIKADSLLESFELSPDDEVLRIIDQSFSQVYTRTFMNITYPLGTNEVDSSLLLDVKMDEKVIAERMELLNRNSPFELTHNNNVQAFINLYLVKKRDVTERIMGLAPYYYPIFEEELARHNLPMELKYLPIVESALNPRAKSRAGAVGLWQFMYRTGRMYGLNVNSYYDERMDPIQSSVAACEFLSMLYKMYHDWNLVIAAYNCGPGNVNKAIRRSGGKKDYWEIRHWLPRETRGYVPAFIAVNYTMNHAQDHGLVPRKPPVEIYPTDTIHVCNKISFASVSKTLDISEDWLRYFNPMYSLDMIPESDQKLTICLPQDKIGAFIVNEDSIYAFHRQMELIEKPAARAEEKQTHRGEEVVHKVRSGEVLGSIAQRYRCNVTQIKEWNNLRTSKIYPGQKLVIYSSHKPTAATHEQPQQKTPAPKTEIKMDGKVKYEYYTVQPGDTLWDIAKKYKEVTVNDLKKLNSDLDFKKLKPGDKIKVSKVG